MERNGAQERPTLDSDKKVREVLDHLGIADTEIGESGFWTMRNEGDVGGQLGRWIASRLSETVDGKALIIIDYEKGFPWIVGRVIPS